MSLDSFLPVTKDDGGSLGLEGSGFAPVPIGCLPACKSNPRRKRRRFTNGEKAIISYKRKVGVCEYCRQAKRKASLVMTSVIFC